MPRGSRPGDRLVVIRTFGSQIEAQVARAVLEASGIRAVLLADNAGGMLPPLQILFPIRLAVARRDVARARALLDQPPELPDEDEEESP